tara:strand:+ start:322 stop:654 length:333 start_codon:yes stop_codon:yes gene_type:complete
MDNTTTQMFIARLDQLDEKIDKQGRQIELHDSRLQSHATASVQRVENVVAKIDKVDKLLRGNGTPGLVTEVDRLKQNEIRRDWWIKTLLVAAAAEVVVVVKLVFYKGVSQ